MDLQSYFAYLASFLAVGSFVFIDLIAATTNALNGALLSQRPTTTAASSGRSSAS